MQKAVSVGLIGAGFMGRAVAESVCRVHSGISIRSVYDPDPGAISASRQSFGDEFVVADSLEQLLNDEALDWVMIASWNKYHAEQTIAAFEAGKHVFCQKPLSLTIDECLAMRAAWRRSERKFVIGFNLRYSPHYRKIHSLVAEGVIGDLVSFEFNETLHFNHGGFIMSDWRRHSAHAGSHLLEKCCHDVDLTNWIVGSRASRVASFAGLNFFDTEHAGVLERVGTSKSGRQGYMSWRGSDQENPFTSEKDIADNQVVIIEYENGVRATMHMNSNTAIPERRMYLCGTEGTLRADLYRNEIEVRRIGYGEEVIRFETSQGDLHGGGDDVLADELAATMMRGDQVSTTLDDGLNAAVTCFAIDQAEACGQVVDCSDSWRRVDEAP